MCNTIPHVSAQFFPHEYEGKLPEVLWRRMSSRRYFGRMFQRRTILQAILAPLCGTIIIEFTTTKWYFVSLVDNVPLSLLVTQPSHVVLKALLVQRTLRNSCLWLREYCGRKMFGARLLYTSKFVIITFLKLKLWYRK